MRKTLFLVMTALAACGDDLSAPEDAGPAEPPPDAMPEPEPPLPPEAGGEYVIKVSPTLFQCVSSGPQATEAFYSTADVVPQDPRTIDLVSELQGTLIEYDRVDLGREPDGSFDDHWEGYAAFWDFLLTVFRDIEDSAADGRTLSFDHRYDIGWDDDQGNYHSECVYEAGIAGSLLHERWDGSGRDGVTGQWWTEREVLASPLQYARRDVAPKGIDGRPLDPRDLPAGTIVMFRDRRGGPISITVVGSSPRPLYRKVASRLGGMSSAMGAAAPPKMSRAELDETLRALSERPPSDGPPKLVPVLETAEEAEAMLMETEAEAPLYAHRVSLTTLSQSPTGDVIDIGGIYRPFDRVYRDPQTGTVDAGLLIIMPYVDSDGSSRLMLQETLLTGKILPMTLTLDETWRWWTSATETQPEVEHWLQHETYAGTPRYMPHARSEPEPPHGTYAAEYAMISNDCGYEPYAENRFLQILPTDGGAVWPRITGFDREPLVTPASDGTFSMSFLRATWSGIYAYEISGAIRGHDVAMTMDVTRTDASFPCSATFEIAGEKVYMTARP